MDHQTIASGTSDCPLQDLFFLMSHDRQDSSVDKLVCNSSVIEVIGPLSSSPSEMSGLSSGDKSVFIVSSPKQLNQLYPAIMHKNLLQTYEIVWLADRLPFTGTPSLKVPSSDEHN